MSTELSLWRLFTQAGTLVQIVMLILFVLSILSWSLIIERSYLLHRARQRLSAFKQRFHLHKDLTALYDYLAATQRESKQGVEQVFRLGFQEFARLYKQDLEPNAIIQGAERAMRVGLAYEEEYLEEHLPFLANVGSISVYIGLFGTVWGIMTAFRALGSVQQATLAMVAPGISEALVATALGLFAAIPAVFAYNRLSTHSQSLIRHYDTLAEEFSGALQRRIYINEAEHA